MKQLETGGTLLWDENFLLLSFPEARPSLSTAIYGGGYRTIRYALNQKLTGFFETEADLPGGSPREFLRRSLLARGCDLEESSALLTSARMEWHRHIVKRDGDLIVEAIVTGASERTAARAGDAALYRETDGHFFPCGTINILLSTNARLEEYLMARAFITVTEGKTAAFQDAGIASVSTGRPATGTATDGITLISSPQGSAYTDAGTFSKLGELLAAAARDGVYECLTTYVTPWNRSDAFVTPKAVDIQKLKNGD